MSNLRSLVIQATEAYTNGNPILTDAEFDALEKRFRAESPNDPYFKQVGSQATGAFAKVTHRHLMGSLAKVQSVPEWDDWHAGHKHVGVLSEKLDGISVHLDWFEGSLKQASTRGDGEVGEDITRNVIRMKGIPRELPNLFTGSIRGEILCYKSDLNLHFPEYSNPRNTASGIAKRQDGRGCEHLTVMCYQIFDYTGTKVQEFDHLKHLGFLTPTWYLANSSETVLSVYRQYNEGMRDELDYDIDGLVFEINDYNVKSRYGVQSKRPGGAIAFKFPADVAVTKLNQVVWQTGSSGRVTPVAIFEPVELAGVIVERANLHNVENFLKLSLKPGSLISVSRRNDCIPHVESNLDSLEGA